MAPLALVTLGCLLATTIATPTGDWKFAELEKELRAVFNDDVNESKATVGKRDIEEIEGVTCGFFETIDGKSLFGYNTKTLYDTTAEACMESCAYEYNFYCR